MASRQDTLNRLRQIARYKQAKMDSADAEARATEDAILRRMQKQERADIKANEPNAQGTALKGAATGASIGTSILPGIGSAWGALIGGVAGLGIGAVQEAKAKKGSRWKKFGHAVNTFVNPYEHGKDIVNLMSGPKAGETLMGAAQVGGAIGGGVAQSGRNAELAKRQQMLGGPMSPGNSSPYANPQQDPYKSGRYQQPYKDPRTGLGPKVR